MPQPSGGREEIGASVCDRPRGVTEIPRQSFYSSSRPDVTLLSTPFGTTGSLVQGIIQHAENSKQERGGEGDFPPLRLYEERKSDFSYMPTANPRTALRADHRHAFPWTVILREALRSFSGERGRKRAPWYSSTFLKSQHESP